MRDIILLTPEAYLEKWCCKRFPYKEDIRIEFLDSFKLMKKTPDGMTTSLAFKVNGNIILLRKIIAASGTSWDSLQLKKQESCGLS
jgi:hypothetical protein